MVEDFHLTVEDDTATLLLRMEGEFDLTTIGRVELVLDTIRMLTKHVVFDLRDVSFLDMAALMTVMRINERSHHEAFDVQVVAPIGVAKRVFTLTRAGSELTMVPAAPAVLH
jgi:anti-anti-sigma factor